MGHVVTTPSETARPAQRTAQVDDAALTEGDALTARLLRAPGVEVRPYPPPLLDRSGIRAAGALGVAATLYEAQQSGEKIAMLLSQSNPLAAQSELAHFAVRNVGGWAGGTAAAYALGASGAGPVALVAADAYFMSKFYEQGRREGRRVARQPRHLHPDRPRRDAMVVQRHRVGTPGHGRHYQ
nr:hypothetical protein [Xanthomonas axonopodis]